MYVPVDMVWSIWGWQFGTSLKLPGLLTYFFVTWEGISFSLFLLVSDLFYQRMGWLVILSGSEVNVSVFKNKTGPTRRTLLKVCAQIQCALYEEILDAVNDVIDSECTYVRQSPEFQLPMYLKMRQTLFHFLIEIVNLCFHL